MTQMVMNECGIGMMLLGWLGAVLGLVGSLIVLTWVTIRHLRRQSIAPQANR